jgi:hypothetical protein
VADRILAFFAIATLAAYFVPLLVKVPAPALAVVLVLAVLMAAYDFFLEIRDQERGERDKPVEIPRLDT